MKRVFTFILSLVILSNVYGTISFTADVQEGCAPLTITFTNTSNEGVNYNWDFGDGNYSSEENPVHTYNYSGSYYCTLTVYDSLMNYLGDYYKYISVYSADNYLYLSKSEVCPNEQFYVSINGNSSSVTWDFGDGTTGSGYYAYHSYSDIGTYTIISYIDNLCGTDTVSETITVNTNLPFTGYLNLWIYANELCPGDEFSYDISAGGAYFTLDFGDGSSTSSSYGQHSYTSSGTYFLTLTAYNTCGNDSSITDTIHIQDNIPINAGANADVYFSPACPDQKLYFEAWGGNVNDFQWTFGDGQSTSTNNDYVVHSYNATGMYTATVIMTNGCGNDTTLNVQVEIRDDLPVNTNIEMQISEYNLCPGQKDYFEINGMDVASVSWDFGDGSTSAQDYAQHSYASVGMYIVSATATNYCNNDTTLYDTVYVSDNLYFDNYISFGVNPQTVCPGQLVGGFAYSDGVASQIWNFGDGTTSTEDYPSHSYSNTGTYLVSVTLTNYCGNDTTLTQMVTVDDNTQIQNAYIGASASSACPGEQIEFYASSGMETYQWDFGDGSSATGNYLTHTYSTLGTYQVYCTITNQCGNSYVANTSVTISDNVGFSYLNLYASSSEACPGDAIMFDAYSENEATFFWSFGDGTNATGEQVNHAFQSAGNYTVTLTATNMCGVEQHETVFVQVGNNVYPNPDDYEFGTIDVEFCPNSDVLFYAFPVGSDYLWDFGDGSSTAQTEQITILGGMVLDIATHQYSSIGNYDVSLTLTNSCGNSFTESFPISIGNNVPINAEIDYYADQFIPGAEINFAAYGGDFYIWNFGDGSATQNQSGSIVETTHAYNTYGTFEISCIVSNACGNTDTLYETVMIIPSNEKEITSFRLVSFDPDVVGVIDQLAKTISLIVPNGTDVTALIPTITFVGESLSPLSGVAQNFTSPVTYTVTAENSSTVSYTVTVTIAPPGASSDKAITAFSFDSFNPVVEATINESIKQISATVPHGTDLTNLVASFTHTGVSIVVGGTPQVSGATVNDFTNLVEYVVNAEDGTSAAYLVIVNEDVSVEEISGLSYSLYPNPNNGMFVIEFSEKTVDCLVEIYNITGSLIDSFELKKENKHQFDLSNKSKGVYFVKLRGEHINDTQIVIID